MDEALAKALEFSNFTTTLNSQKRILEENYKEDLILYHNGGKFSVTQTLFSFVANLKLLNVEKTVLVDNNNTPVEIYDVNEFLTLCTNRYAEASNNYLIRYKDLSKKRNIEGLVDV